MVFHRTSAGQPGIISGLSFKVSAESPTSSRQLAAKSDAPMAKYLISLNHICRVAYVLETETSF